MAICPECRGDMKTLDLVCPHCGYDFPPTEKPATEKFRREGIEYSPLADIALLVSALAAAAGCVVSLFLMGVSLFATRQWLHAFVIFPLSFFLLLGMLVVFLRAMRAS